MEEIAHVIQLSVAPVFLLTGVGAILNVLTGRLARVIDRARALAGHLQPPQQELQPHLQDELRALKKRMKLIDLSISLCTFCALTICTVVASLFIGSFWQWDVSKLVGFLFIIGMTALIAALLLFLQEIFIATTTVRLGIK